MIQVLFAEHAQRVGAQPTERRVLGIGTAGTTFTKFHDSLLQPRDIGQALGRSGQFMRLPVMHHLQPMLDPAQKSVGRRKLRRRRGGTVLWRRSTKLAVNLRGQETVVPWRVPARFSGAYVWCLRSKDESGNRSALQCASFRA